MFLGQCKSEKVLAVTLSVRSSPPISAELPVFSSQGSFPKDPPKPGEVQKLTVHKRFPP